MSDEDSSSGKKKIKVSLGDLEVQVYGKDEEWVHETFERVWADRLAEASEMKDAIREDMNGIQ